MKYFLKLLIGLLSLSIQFSAEAQKDNTSEVHKKWHDKQMGSHYSNIISHQKDYLEQQQKLLKAARDSLNRLSEEIKYLKSNISLIKRNPEQYREQKKQLLADSIYKMKESMVSYAVSFLKIPYEEYSIQKVAIPSFEKGKGTEKYEKEAYRGLILKNYANDWEILKNFLQENKDITYEKAENVKQNLLNLSTYIQYAGGVNPDNGNKIPGYGQNWDSTYLGKIMRKLLNALGTGSRPEYNQRLQKAFKEAIELMM